MAVLVTPMVVYATIMLNLEEAKTEQQLKSMTQTIIAQMNRFDPKTETTFYFPRFKSYTGGLYARNGTPIFTTMAVPPANMTQGYSRQGIERYYVSELPEGIYFGAKYLVVAKSFDYSELAVRLLVTTLLIFIIVYAASYLLNKEFEKPLRRVNEQLDTFVKDAVHEINTPLAIIYANVELFNELHGPSLYLSRIKAAAKSLSMIYNDMDYLIKRQRMDYPKTTLDFSRFLQERVDYFSEIAAMRNIVFETEIASHMILAFNETKLARIVDNNLSNAIKYSHEDARIVVTLRRDGDTVVLSVRDYGIGIENSKAIFYRYYREDEAKGGFGIGLAIVKSICDENGVTIRVNSKLNEGTEFSYVFPLKV